VLNNNTTENTKTPALLVEDPAVDEEEDPEVDEEPDPESVALPVAVAVAEVVAVAVAVAVADPESVADADPVSEADAEADEEADEVVPQGFTRGLGVTPERSLQVAVLLLQRYFLVFGSPRVLFKGLQLSFLNFPAQAASKASQVVSQRV